MQHDVEQAVPRPDGPAHEAESAPGAKAHELDGGGPTASAPGSWAGRRNTSDSILPPGFNLHETPAEQDARIRRARAVLASLREGDPEEQRETWEYLKKALNDNRPSYAKLFVEDE